MLAHHVTPNDERLARRGWIVTEEGCWSLNGSPTTSGYIQILSSDGTRPSAHRLAYETWVGLIPTGNVVRHKCDNRRCINPDHLDVGTQADNVRDRELRGRNAKGSGHGMAKMTEHEVGQIKHLLNMGWSLNQTAELFGVSKKTVLLIRQGKTWKHVE